VTQELRGYRWTEGETVEGNDIMVDHVEGETIIVELAVGETIMAGRGRDLRYNLVWARPSS